MEKPLFQNHRLPVSVSAAVFIEDEQGRLLLLQQAGEKKGHRWGPVAGGMDAHEDPKMTAEREAREEIGVEVGLIDLIGVYTVDRGDSTSGVGFVFRGQIISGDITLKEDEIMDFHFFTLQEIQDLIEEGMLYKPEYNLAGIQDWIEGKSFALEVIQSLSS